MSHTSEVHGIVVAGAYPVGRSALDLLVPRPLLPVAQQPLVTYALRWMRRGGLERATICANSAARSLRHRLDGAALGMGLEYLEDWSPRGTAGCVRDAGARSAAGTFVVADGTAVPLADMSELLEAHRSSGAVLTVVVGADATGRLCPTGVYVFDRRAFERIPVEGFQDIKERLIPKLYEGGDSVETHVVRAAAPRVVSTDTYLALDQWAVERALEDPELPQGFRIRGEAIVHESAVVDPSARLLGPMLLGPGATVQAGATLIGPLSIGSRTSVARGAVVSRSVVWSSCRIGTAALVDRCMLADGAEVGPNQPLVAALKADEQRTRGSRRPAGALLEPITAALRPVSPTQP